jgi:hypothetical protein
MTGSAKPMLDTYPRDFNVDADALAHCIDECLRLRGDVHAVRRRLPTPTTTSTAGSAPTRAAGAKRPATRWSAR